MSQAPTKGTGAHVIHAAGVARTKLLEASTIPSPVKRDNRTREALGELDRALAAYEARAKRLHALEPMDPVAKVEALREAATYLEAWASSLNVSTFSRQHKSAMAHASRFKVWAEILEHDATDTRVPRIGWRAFRKLLGSLVGIAFALLGLLVVGGVLGLMWKAFATGWGLSG